MVAADVAPLFLCAQGSGSAGRVLVIRKLTRAENLFLVALKKLCRP